MAATKKTPARKAIKPTAAQKKATAATRAARQGNVSPAMAKVIDLKTKAPVAPAAKPPVAKAPAKAEAKAKPLGIRAQAEADAAAGKLPTPPDFSADTHKSYRARLAELVKAVQAGDIKALEKGEMIPDRVSTSPNAMRRYRDLAVIALKAKATRKSA